MLGTPVNGSAVAKYIYQKPWLHWLLGRSVFGGLLGGLLWEGEDAPAGLLAPFVGELPDRVRAWGDGQRIRVALLDLHDMDLRARRTVLERLAPALADGDVALILDWEGVSPGEIRELQTVAELLGIA